MGLYDYREFIANEAACIDLLRDVRWPKGDVKGNTLTKLVKQHVEKGSTVYTDGWKGYKGLEKHGFTHKAVDHT